MKKHSIFILLLFSKACYSQTIQDYKDYVKLHVEAAPAFPEGIYFLKIMAGEKEFGKKIIIEHN